MTYKVYRADLLGRMHEFARSDRFSVEMFDPDLADPNRPPVFRREFRHLNLVLPGDLDLAGAIRASVPSATQHKWFGSMMSSQALAQSVFGALIAMNRLDVLGGIRDEAGHLAFEGIDDRGESKLEKEVDWLGELQGRSTSVDVYFGSPSGYRVAVECKFTERDFGACSRPGLDENHEDLCDGSYSIQLGRQERCSLAERGIAYWRYIPEILGWSADEDHMPCPARFTYQLVRNVLAALVHDHEVDFDAGHALLVYDGRNPRFQPDGVARLAVEQIHEALGPHTDRLRLVTWQDIVSALSGVGEVSYLVEELELKYGEIPLARASVGDTASPHAGGSASLPTPG